MHEQHGSRTRRPFVDVVDSQCSAVGIFHLAVVRREWKIRQVVKSRIGGSKNLQSAPLMELVGPIGVLVIWMLPGRVQRRRRFERAQIDASKSIQARATEPQASAARRPCRADARALACRTGKLFPPRSAPACG